MPGTTPNNGYPYPVAADPDNVPGDLHALALALDGPQKSTGVGIVTRILQAIAGQTADLFQFKDAPGTTTLAKVDVAGNMTAPAFSATTTSQVSVLTSELCNNAAYVDMTTPGPQVTIIIPPSGKCWINLKADLTNLAAHNDALMSFAMFGASNNRGASASDALGMRLHHMPSFAGDETTCSARFLLTGLTPGSTSFIAKYSSGAGGNNMRAANRMISVEPA
ncbi:MAG: hypothetical protein M3O32_17135 [Actinomycetota bacterium]|nr:hypothetical protein [Actinomycetota bacterium]